MGLWEITERRISDMTHCIPLYDLPIPTQHILVEHNKPIIRITLIVGGKQ